MQKILPLAIALFLTACGWGQRDAASSSLSLHTERNPSPIFAARQDCEAIIRRLPNKCVTEDCEAVLYKRSVDCGSRDCRAMIARSVGMCQTDDCRAVIEHNLGRCVSNNCRAVINRQYTLCR